MKSIWPDALLPVLTLIAGWLLKGKKLKADTKLVEANVESIELANVDRAVKIWRELAQSLDNKVTILSQQVNTLIEENKILRLKISSLEKQIAEK